MTREIDIPEYQYNNIMAFDSVNLGRVPYKGIIMYAINAIKRSKALEQTKNDLGVDAISRADVLKLMQDNWHTHNGDWAMQESMDDIRVLPSVTPQLSSELEKNSKKHEKDFGESDCISRADAIKAMQDKAKELTNEDTINGLCGAVAILFDLPSVTTKNDSGVDLVSRPDAINAVSEALKHTFVEYEDIANKIIGKLPTITPQEPILDKIRGQMKDYLRGVEITLEVLVENDPLRPKMEGAKDTLEECLELIDKAESEVDNG